MKAALLPMVIAVACVKSSGAPVDSSTLAKEHEEIMDGLPPWMTKGEEVRLAVVRELLKTDNTSESLSILREMRTKGYDSPEVDLLEGKALRIDGVSSESERLLLQARKRMGRDPRPNAELCLLYADLQRVDEAVDACRRATQGDDATAASYNNLGFLQLVAGHAEDALEACQAAVERDGGESRYRNNLGMAQAANGQPDQAFRTFKSTMNAADAAYMVGLALERFSDADDARKWYDKALEIDPNHAQTRLRLEGVAEVEGAGPAPETPAEEGR